jgi:hypothetical protein
MVGSSDTLGSPWPPLALRPQRKKSVAQSAEILRFSDKTGKVIQGLVKATHALCPAIGHPSLTVHTTSTHYKITTI